MAGRIPSEFLQQVLARTDLAGLIGRYVALKKAGAEYKACCPFHNEKTPSFTVSPRKGFYHCFGCGAHGTAISFLMEYQRYSFPDAVEELASQAGMQVPREPGAEAARQKLDPLYECMEAACEEYRKQLSRSRPAQAYASERGLSGKICEEYRIGFAPPGFDNIEPWLKSRFSREILLKVGLLTKKDNRTYDKFRNRLMFPIRDSRGRVLAFGGRVIDAKDQPKYMNSPDTPLFHKGRVLYGMHELLQRRGKISYLILTEGYMDVVSLAQAGVRNVLATLGTATTEDHIRQMGRFCRTFVFCFDGDPAGRDAGWRALENLLPVLREGDEIRFAYLPEGEDPDSFIRARGGPAWKKFIAQAQPLEDFFFFHLTQGLNLDMVSGKSALVQRARPLLGRIGAPVFRDLMVRKLGEMTGLSEEKLRLAPPEEAASAAGRARAHPPGRPSVLRVMIRLLLEYPGLVELALPQKELQELQGPGYGLFAEVADLIRRNPSITSSGIVESFHGQESERILKNLLRWTPAALSGVSEEKQVRRSFRKGMLQFEDQWLIQKMRPLLDRQTRGQALTQAQKEELANFKHRRAELREPEAKAG